MLFLSLVMHCTLAADKLYKKPEGKDNFLSFLQDVCTLIHQNALSLERNPSTVAIDNIARLTGRNHWPVKRETPQEWKPWNQKPKGAEFVWQKQDSQGLENT